MVIGSLESGPPGPSGSPLAHTLSHAHTVTHSHSHADTLLGGHESRRCSRDTYRESNVTEYTGVYENETRRIRTGYSMRYREDLDDVLKDISVTIPAGTKVCHPRATYLLLPSLILSDAKDCEPQIRARLETPAHFCQVVVLTPRLLTSPKLVERLWQILSAFIETRCWNLNS